MIITRSVNTSRSVQATSTIKVTRVSVVEQEKRTKTVRVLKTV